jgi:hypothetical protein
MINQITDYSNRLYSNTAIQIKISNVLKSFDQIELDKFCNRAYSKEIFDLDFCLLVKVMKNYSKEKTNEIIKLDNVNRWTLKYPIEKNNCIYAISTQWYPHNDQFVKNWLKENEK